jgi:hypothetical protein
MDELAKLRYLMDLAEDLGVQIRRAPAGGDSEGHPGGALVRLGSREMLFLDPSAALEDQLAAAADALQGRPSLQDRFLPPEIRDLLG